MKASEIIMELCDSPDPERARYLTRQLQALQDSWRAKDLQKALREFHRLISPLKSYAGHLVRYEVVTKLKAVRHF